MNSNRKRSYLASRSVQLGCVALTAALLFGATSTEAQRRRLQEQEEETIRRTFEIGNPSTSRLEVDNVDGTIDVVGYDGTSVELTVHKTIRARSDDRLEVARQEIGLDISEREKLVRLYVDGPFRDDSYSGNRNGGYEVRFDFELRVPREMELFLRAVNNGDIAVEETSGDYDIKTINGGVQMTGISGSGDAYALNGEMDVTFDRNPDRDSYFGSLNGDIDVRFIEGLSADFRLKTFTGEAFTDFDTSQLPNPLQPVERKNGRFVYTNKGFFGVRVGSGGPEIELDAFNGDIHIIRQEQ